MNVVSERPKLARQLLALLVSLAVALGGSLIGLTPAHAAGGPTVSVTVAPTDGGQVTVTGTGFAAASPGIYVGLGAADGSDFYADFYAVFAADALVDTVWVSPTNADGGPDGARTSKMNADGSFSVTFTVPASSEATPAYAVYTSKAHGMGMSDPSQNAITAISYAPEPQPEPEPEPEPVIPTVTVSKTTGLSSNGEIVTVTGSGFLSDGTLTNGTRQPLPGTFSGTYVIFGKFADVWQPSKAAPGSSRKAGDTKWAILQADLDTNRNGLRPQDGAILLNANGTFTAQLTVKKGFGEPQLGNYGIYTYAGSGATYAPFETYTPVTFAADATSLSFNTVPAAQTTEGGQVTLRAQVASAIAGSVTFSSEETILGTVPTDSSGLAELAVPSLAVGAHTLKAVFTPTDASSYAPSTMTSIFTVVAKPVVVAAGSLTWGVKESFRSYVAGSIAKGTITASGVGMTGGSFVFSQAAGGSFNGSTGTSAYAGSVRFQGHGGVLDLRLSNPVVRVDSASSGTLMLSVNGATVPFATLALASGTKRVADGAVSYSNVPATLTAQGAAAFVNGDSQFYPAGTALDPLSFVIGAPSAAGGGNFTAAAFVAVTKGIPPTPPATTGITLDPESAAGGVVEGGEVTITADGFQPNEQGIKVVIYSEPTTLATDARADANGVVTWTGRLPAGLTGEHTLTLQGSVDRGIVLDIQAKQTTLAGGCLVADAEISWGFNEAFRSYISGSIANGEWTVAEGASYETPNFGWSAGEGNYDGASEEGLLSFLGSVQFTGHSGVLNTTIANPQLRFDGGDKATLLLDVVGTTQSGEPVSEQGVEFVTIDLAAATATVEGKTHTFAGAPTVLTPAGAAAFGTYEAGTDFDPITVSFSEPSGCATAPMAQPTAEASSEIADTAPNLGWLLWLGAALLLAAAIAWIIIARRRAGSV